MTEHLLKTNSPIYNLQVFLRVISQKHHDIPPVLPDGFYGDATQTAITAFQNLHNLPPTGITDNLTWNKILSEYSLIEKENYAKNVSIFPKEGLFFENESFVPTLTIIQTMLFALSQKFSNLAPLSVSGVFDKQTSDAVIKFQYLSGLLPDGNITSPFWNILSSVYEAYISDNRIENSL